MEPGSTFKLHSFLLETSLKESLYKCRLVSVPGATVLEYHQSKKEGEVFYKVVIFANTESEPQVQVFSGAQRDGEIRGKARCRPLL